VISARDPPVSTIQVVLGSKSGTPKSPTIEHWIWPLLAAPPFSPSTNLRNLALNHVCLQIDGPPDRSDFTFLKAIMGSSSHFFQPGLPSIFIRDDGDPRAWRNGAPARPFEESYEGLWSNCLSPHNAHHLWQDETFAKLYDGERIRSSIFTRGPKRPWELKSVTVHSNVHSIVHDPQSTQDRRTNMTIRKSEEDTWQSMPSPKRICWRRFNEITRKGRPQREPRFAIIVRRNSIRK
jgi:hypothetical protein